MLKYMLLMKLTPVGAKLIKEWPKMIEETINGGYQLGIKAIEFYAGGAVYDFIAIGEMADGETAEFQRRLVMAGGYLEAYVVPLLDKEKFNKMLAGFQS